MKSAGVGVGEAPRGRSLRRDLGLGAGIFGTAGALFALAVVTFADCLGSACNHERVIGVAGHALAGAVIGAICGAAVHGLRRVFGHRSRGRAR